MSIDISPLRAFIEELTGQASPLQWAVQAAIIAVSLSLAWLLSKRFCGRFHVSPRWKFGAGEFQRVMFPLMALALVWTSKLAMEHVTQPVTLLGIAMAPEFIFKKGQRRASDVPGEIPSASRGEAGAGD